MIYKQQDATPSKTLTLSIRARSTPSRSLVSSVPQNELGIRKWLEDQGHTLVTTSDKEGESSVFEKEMVDAEVIITTP